MIKFTEKAKSQLKKYSDKNLLLQLTVQPGGCSGMTYDAEVIFAPPENLQIIHKEEDITVYSDQFSLPFLEGLEIDFSDDLISAGFRFNNHQNENSCGCGASFSTTGFPQPISGVTQL